MGHSVLVVLGCRQVICGYNDSALGVIDTRMILGGDETLPEVVLEPALLGIDSLVHVVLALGEHASHVVAVVAALGHEVEVKRV